MSFGGAASFTGHGGLLDLTISNPVIQVTGARTATLSAYVQSQAYGGSPSVDGRVVLANLTLPAATTRGGAIVWTDAAATLTAAGAEAFGGFYSAGESLDPVSFTFPLGAEVPCDTATSGALAATGGSMPDGTVARGTSMRHPGR
ncbi:Htaa protein [Microbacterium sp. AG790]|uniref:HtaA domain-containing protein n=1 Tax=Microbacterium sp. AG790 TaxID=2183995 RepID=UPI000F13322F|nr:HtaA domain-containing protein [Microbacterium sp. AG790]RKS90130.1 Htaa protein [Microbacterium sp. AG790]